MSGQPELLIQEIRVPLGRATVIVNDDFAIQSSPDLANHADPRYYILADKRFHILLGGSCRNKFSGAR